MRVGIDPPRLDRHPGRPAEVTVRSLLGRIVAAVVLVASVGCDGLTSSGEAQGSASPGEAALIFVVRDLAGLLTFDVVDDPRVIAERFAGSRPYRQGSPIPSAVLDASGLPLALDSLSRGSKYVVFYLFEPRVFGLDSIVVPVEWIEWDPTVRSRLSNWWGQEWRYVLRCDPVCTQLRRELLGINN